MPENRNDAAATASNPNINKAARLTHNIACPDCTGIEVDNHLDHDQTCPLGVDLDAISDADRRFFEEHPRVGAFYRPIMTSEVADLRRVGVLPDVPGHAVGKVLVTNIRQGVRTRRFDRVLYLLDLGAAS